MHHTCLSDGKLTGNQFSNRGDICPMGLAHNYIIITNFLCRNHIPVIDMKDFIDNY